MGGVVRPSAILFEQSKQTEPCESLKQAGKGLYRDCQSPNVNQQRGGPLGENAGLAEIHKLYRCHDRLLVHKQAVFDHLVGRWRDLFNISYDVLLYDLTSTYFEAGPSYRRILVTA